MYLVKRGIQSKIEKDDFSMKRFKNGSFFGTMGKLGFAWMLLIGLPLLAACSNTQSSAAPSSIDQQSTASMASPAAATAVPTGSNAATTTGTATLTMKLVTINPSPSPETTATVASLSPSATPINTLTATEQPSSSTSAVSYFTNGEVIINATGYKSAGLYINIKNIQQDGINYYMADCRMKESNKLFAAFAEDTYGKDITEYPTDTAKRKGAVLAIDGDYYNARDEGFVIRNGKLFRSVAWYDTAAIYNDGTMKTFYKGEISAEQLLADGAMQAFCFGPMLLDKSGKALTEFSEPLAESANPRAGIGYIEPNHFILIVVDGRGFGDSKGIDMFAWARIFEDLGCKSAYNLDGGGSAVMVFMGKIISHPCDLPPTGQRAISDILYFGESETDAVNTALFP